MPSGIKIRDTVLKHYGVLGMRWGVRRYQPYGSGGYNPKKKGKFISSISMKRSNLKTQSNKKNTEYEIQDAVKDTAKGKKGKLVDGGSYEIISGFHRTRFDNNSDKDLTRNRAVVNIEDPQGKVKSISVETNPYSTDDQLQVANSLLSDNAKYFNRMDEEAKRAFDTDDKAISWFFEGMSKNKKEEILNSLYMSYCDLDPKQDCIFLGYAPNSLDGIKKINDYAVSGISCVFDLKDKKIKYPNID